MRCCCMKPMAYDKATGAEALQRYSEYSDWISRARQQGQFVTGEDLEANRGWVLIPSGDGVDVELSASVTDDAPLSGILFIRAKDAEQAMNLAKDLPHIKHGGRVVVQKTIPTDVPPQITE